MNSYFQLDKDIIHLNHAAVGPWPTVTRDAVIAFAEENVSVGSKNYARWMKTEQSLKEKMQQLINASSVQEIAILKNTSEGLSIIAQGIDFNAGDNIVIPAEEFPSNKIVWQALESKGVEVRLVPVDGSPDPERLLIDATDTKTRLISCSSVQFASGLRLDINRIGAVCSKRDILFCVDAIQSLGAIAFDVQACAADFVVADGHKWMCGPEGTALFYCRQAIQASLKLSQFGWHMLKDAFEFSHAVNSQSVEQQIVEGARRFESGSPNMMGIAALDASLGLLLDIGIDNIQKQVLANTACLLNRLAEHDDITIISPTEPGRYAGIVTFRKRGVDNETLYQHLQDKGVICACRGGGVRFSPHFHTGLSTIERALDMVSNYGK